MKEHGCKRSYEYFWSGVYAVGYAYRSLCLVSLDVISKWMLFQSYFEVAAFYKISESRNFPEVSKFFFFSKKKKKNIITSTDDDDNRLFDLEKRKKKKKN